MDEHIFDNLLKYLDNLPNKVNALVYSEIIEISGGEFKEEFLDPVNFVAYTELAREVFVKHGYYWDNDPNNKIIIFKKIN